MPCPGSGRLPAQVWKGGRRGPVLLQAERRESAWPPLFLEPQEAPLAVASGPGGSRSLVQGHRESDGAGEGGGGTKLDSGSPWVKDSKHMLALVAHHRCSGSAWPQRAVGRRLEHNRWLPHPMPEDKPTALRSCAKSHRGTVASWERNKLRWGQAPQPSRPAPAPFIMPSLPAHRIPSAPRVGIGMKLPLGTACRLCTGRGTGPAGAGAQWETQRSLSKFQSASPSHGPGPLFLHPQGSKAWSLHPKVNLRGAQYLQPHHTQGTCTTWPQAGGCPGAGQAAYRSLGQRAPQS